jgi:hypothetical protein
VVCKWVILNKKMSKNFFKFNKITLSWDFLPKHLFKKNDDALKWIMNSRNMKKRKKFQLEKFSKSRITSKPDSTICFWASSLMISFEDLNLIFYIWVVNTTIEVIILGGKSNLNNTLLLLLGLWRKNIMVLVCWSTILVHFTMLAPIQ